MYQTRTGLVMATFKIAASHIDVLLMIYFKIMVFIIFIFIYFSATHIHYHNEKIMVNYF
jgi:hypothetical protein